ncbi:hypothetical protein AGMMS49944_18410 [Spirochaetia bacterium]|nr:hypothetical protein AGMMS49944_18410 [Spirochaetia bacterium]
MNRAALLGDPGCIPRRLRTPAVLYNALLQNGDNLLDIPKHELTEELCLLAVKTSGMYRIKKHIPLKWRKRCEKEAENRSRLLSAGAYKCNGFD